MVPGGTGMERACRRTARARTTVAVRQDVVQRVAGVDRLRMASISSSGGRAVCTATAVAPRQPNEPSLADASASNAMTAPGGGAV
mgnify:CR=1 FL=1